MIDRLEKNRCTGCFACVQKCPKECIDIVKDEEGFLFPKINADKCVSCNLCEKACPQLNEVSKKEPISAYAARIKDEKTLLKSTSGGVFALAAQTILNMNGVAFGVKMDQDGLVQTVEITDKSQLSTIQGSKYIQANVGGSYIKAKRYLDQKRIVLFSGTPCQIAGLYGYLGKDYENLYTYEIVCHGVPSQELFNSYRVWLGKKLGSEISGWTFRSKEKDGWAQIDKLELRSKTVYRRENLDPYTYSYLKSYSLRESCYVCQFCSPERCGDITAGDYWGLRNHHPEFYSDLGVCMLLINTTKGEKLLELMQPEILLLESQYEYMKKYNSGLVTKPNRPLKRNDFYKNFKSKNMDKFVKEDMHVPVNLKEILRQWIPHSLRLKIKDRFLKR